MVDLSKPRKGRRLMEMLSNNYKPDLTTIEGRRKWHMHMLGRLWNMSNREFDNMIVELIDD